VTEEPVPIPAQTAPHLRWSRWFHPAFGAATLFPTLGLLSHWDLAWAMSAFVGALASVVLMGLGSHLFTLSSARSIRETLTNPEIEFRVLEWDAWPSNLQWVARCQLDGGPILPVLARGLTLNARLSLASQCIAADRADDFPTLLIVRDTPAAQDFDLAHEFGHCTDLALENEAYLYVDLIYGAWQVAAIWIFFGFSWLTSLAVFAIAFYRVGDWLLDHWTGCRAELLADDAAYRMRSDLAGSPYEANWLRELRKPYFFRQREYRLRAALSEAVRTGHPPPRDTKACSSTVSALSAVFCFAAPFAEASAWPLAAFNFLVLLISTAQFIVVVGKIERERVPIRERLESLGPQIERVS